jgi:hypothetical protein
VLGPRHRRWVAIGWRCPSPGKTRPGKTRLGCASPSCDGLESPAKPSPRTAVSPWR